LLEKVKLDCAIEREGSNLSAMPEQRSQLYSLVLSIAEKVDINKEAKEEKAERQKRLEKSLLVHESSVPGIKTKVSGTDVVNDLCETSPCATPSPATSDDDNNERNIVHISSDERRVIPRNANNMGDFSKTVYDVLKTDPRLIELQVEEKRLQIEKMKAEVEVVQSQRDMNCTTIQALAEILNALKGLKN